MSAPTAVGARMVGKPRKPVIVVVLSLVTLGIYGLIWDYQVFSENKNYRGQGVGGAVGLLLSIVIAGYFILPMEIQKMYEEDGQQSPVSAVTGVWIIVPLVGFIIYVLQVQKALNTFWVSKGAAPVA